MPADTDDCDLALGVMALEQRLITHSQFVAALKAWGQKENESLADILQDRGALSETDRSKLASIAAALLARPAFEVTQSIEAKSDTGAGNGKPRYAISEQIAATLAQVNAPERGPQTSGSATRSDPHSEALRFRILRRHAQGGLGVVFVAQDEELNREVALKEIQARFADDESARARFLLEAEITGGLEHPGIVPVYGLGMYPDGRPYYAMRFIKGDSLKEAIERFHGIGNSAEQMAASHSARSNPFRDPAKQLELRKLLGRFLNVCQAIEYAHSRGVLHRDIKPGNIMLGKYGETLVVDWGLAKVHGQAELPVSADREAALMPASGSSVEPTQMGSAVGTLAYMSPEQATGCLDQLGPATDIFSLGATLFHLLTGRTTLEGTQGEIGTALRRVQAGDLPTPRQVLSQVPIGLDAICRRAMANAHVERYPSAQALADDVERWLADEAVSAAPDTLGARAARWARKHRGWVQAGSIAVILLAVVATVAALLVNSQRQIAVSLAGKNLVLANERKTALDQEEQQRKAAENARNDAVAAKKAAEEARGQETIAKEESFAARLVAERRLAESYLDRGRSLCEQSDIDQGLLWMARALAILPTNSPDLEHLIRANLGAWRARMHTAVLAVPQASFIRGMAYSPSGERFVTACDNGLVRVWSSTTGELIHEVKHGAGALCVAFSLDGRLLASGGRDKALRFWDATTGVVVGKPCLHDEEVTAIAFHPDGQSAVVGSGGTTPQGGFSFWNIATSERTGPRFEAGGGITSLAISADGKRIVTGSGRAPKGPGSGWCQLWDAETGLALGSELRQRFRTVAADITRDGKVIASGSWDATACLWDADTSRLLHPPLRLTGGCNSICFNPDGKLLLTGSASGKSYLWNVETAEKIGQAITGNAPVNCCCFSPDGTHVLLGGGENTAWIWKITNPRPEESAFENMEAGGIAIGPDGQTVVSGVQMYDLRSRQKVGEPFPREPGYLAASFSPDCRRVVIGTRGNQTRIYDVASRQPLGKALTHSGTICGVAFSPDGTRVATASFDRTARLWDAETGEPLGQPMKHPSKLWSVAFHPEGKIIATSCESGSVRLWDAFQGTPLGEPLQCPVQTYEVAFHPEGKVLAIAGSDNRVRLWDIERREYLPHTLPHGGFVARVNFSSDGKLLATGSNDTGVRIWDVATNKQIGPVFWNEGQVLGVCFSPDARTLLSATEHSAVPIWHHPPIAKGPATQIEARLSELSRQELTANGELQLLDAATWLRRRKPH